MPNCRHSFNTMFIFFISISIFLSICLDDIVPTFAQTLHKNRLTKPEKIIVPTSGNRSARCPSIEQTMRHAILCTAVIAATALGSCHLQVSHCDGDPRRAREAYLRRFPAIPLYYPPAQLTFIEGSPASLRQVTVRDIVVRNVCSLLRLLCVTVREHQLFEFQDMI